MYNFFVLAVVVLCLRRGVGQTIHRRAALFNTLENFRVINGDLIKRQRSQSLGTCTQQCLSEALRTSAWEATPNPPQIFSLLPNLHPNFIAIACSGSYGSF